jgi:AraC family transcriptional regulator
MLNTPKKDQTDSRMVKVNSLNSNLNCTHILHGRSQQHYANWAGHLSLKTFSKGQAFYNAGAGHYAVNDDTFLILNELQSYTITIDAEKPVEPFIVFFETDLAEDVSRSLTAKSAQLLDDPEKPFTERLNFVQKLYSRKFIEDVLSDFRTSLPDKKNDQLWLKEKLHQLMQRILAAHRNTFREIEQISSVRSSTRKELYQRVYRARDFIAAVFHQPVTLDEIARVACLSTNHLLRSFKQIFGQTPHQYLTGLRLAEAQKLLKKTELPVIQICQSVGFESHSSFSLLFRRHFGVSPQTYRCRKR